jgi:hypothetical protein
MSLATNIMDELKTAMREKRSTVALEALEIKSKTNSKWFKEISEEGK